MDEVNSLVIEAVIGVVGSALTWFLWWVRKQIQDKVKNDYLQGLLLRLASAVETSVRETAQTTVPIVKEAASDGKISPEERLRLKQRVREAAVDQLTKLDRERLEELFDRQQLERMLDRQIEAVVQRLKER